MATQRPPDPIASPVPTRAEDMTPRLSAQTLAWLADRPHARTVVRSVWNTLTDLQQADDDPGVIAALRVILIGHQPSTRTGRCRACRRSTWRRLWRRQGFPCTIWFDAHLGLQGFFTGHHPGRSGPDSRGHGPGGTHQRRGRPR